MPDQKTVKPHIFIGSSSQAKIVAEAIQYSLRDVAQGQPWTQNVFEQTEPFLTSLLNEAEKADFAILVMTPDDFVKVRDQAVWVPRDNVIFELGLFLGKLGPNRTFVVLQESGETPKLPTGLLGVTFSLFKKVSDADIEREIQSACFPIAQKVRQYGLRTNNQSGELLITRERLTEPELRLRWNDIEKRCQEDLLIAGWSCANVISPKTRDLFKELCESKRSVRLLVLHPDVFKGNRFEMGPICNISTAHVETDALKAVGLIDDIRKIMSSDAQRRFHVKGTKWFMSWSAVGVDMMRPGGFVQVELYHYQNPYKIPVHLDKRPNLILDQRSSFHLGFAESLETMWNHAITL